MKDKNIIKTPHDISEENNNYNFWASRALYLHDKGDLKAAELAYKKAIKLNPNNSDIWYRYANLQMELKNPDESRVAFNKSLFLNL